MPFILFTYHIFVLILLCFFTVSCGLLPLNKMNTVTDSLKNTPQGSYIKPYIKTSNFGNADYKIFLNKNLGETRHETETATLIIPIRFKKITFELRSDDSLIALKTPLKLINITDNINNSLMSLHLHNKIYWIKIDNTYTKIPLFLNIHPQKFIIKNYGRYLLLTVNNAHYKIPVDNPPNTMVIGIIRSDLLRYRGQIVPEQHLYINNIQIRNDNGGK